MNQHHPPNPERDETLPPELAEELRAVAQHHVHVPAEVDDAVLEAAHHRLAGIRRRQWRRRLGAGVAAAAAVIVIGTWLSWPMVVPGPQPVQHRLAGRVAEDLDGSGRVDVLDAFALARRLERGEAPDADLDFNGDGVVDERDVETVARQAVALNGGRGS